MDDKGAFLPYLGNDEQLLWQGTPDPRVWFTAADLFAIPFSIMWCAFAIFWEDGVMSSGAPLLFRLWGIPFVAVGLYMVFGRFFYKWYRKSRTVYGLTTQRAMVLGPRSFTYMPLWNQPMTLKRSRGRSHASVVIGAVPERRWGSRTTPAFYANTGLDLFSRKGDLPFGFYDVANPDAMLAALEQARSRSHST